MANFNDMFSKPSPDQFAPATKPGAGVEKPVDTASAELGADYSKETLLELWEQIHKEAYDNRWVFEKQWQRNIWYMLYRQWIEYHSRYGGWKDKRMASWIPRPVTNVCKTTVQAIRSMFASIKLGVNVRPNGAAPKNVQAAATGDELAPVLHENHKMDNVLSEFDFWLCVCGNAFMHTYLDYDIANGFVEDPVEQCQDCGAQYPSSKLAGPKAVCPDCEGTNFAPAVDPLTGEAVPPIQVIKGKPKTLPLSPLEIAFPNQYQRFDELPYIVRMRWRTKRYFKNNPELKDLVETISWQKASADQSMNMYQALSKQNDLGITPIYWAEGSSGTGSGDDGIPEYEVWMRPCADYPQGCVFRVFGDKNPIIAELKEESIPGPLPYKDADGKPLFTFTHAAYEHVGGRIIGSSVIDTIIQKQDQLNQLDSMILLIVQRMANPVWFMPKGAEVNKLTGMPGLVVKWDSLVSGNAKPEREPGIGPDASLFKLREQYMHDIEELAGTFDVIKGAKPTGVEAFSALQLLVERSQARFASVFAARGTAYRDWYKFALELERDFGDDEIVKASLGPSRLWTFKTFKKEKLQGSVSIIVEDGTASPKTTLGIRAAIDHASQLGMLNMADPDQQYEGLKMFGLQQMVPTLDVHVQRALQKQEAFEDWAKNPDNIKQFVMLAQKQQEVYATQLAGAKQVNEMGDPSVQVPPAPSPLEYTPLKWRKWYDPMIHRQEFLKWANSDSINELLAENEGLAGILELHLVEIEQNLVAQMQMMAAAVPAPKPGVSRSMSNSNQNSASNGGAGQGQQKQPGLSWE